MNEALTFNKDGAKRYADIHWPDGFHPEPADFFAHNEIVVKASCKTVWDHIIEAEKWPSWYSNSHNTKLLNSADGKLHEDTRFSWDTFGLHVDCCIGEFVANSRIGWFGDSNGTNACHTFLLLDGGEGCHIITEEVVEGKGAVEFRQKQPNAVHEGHDLWLKALKDLPGKQGAIVKIGFIGAAILAKRQVISMKTRREFLATTIAAAASLTNNSGQVSATLRGLSIAAESRRKDTVFNDSIPGGQDMTDKAEDPRVRRARLSGPEHVTTDATVAEMAAHGTMTVLVKGTNEWVCTPGDENKIGDPPMCMNPMGMRWMMDAMQGKPKPTNTAPGMIYMLCGATQRSNTNPADRTSPAIPIGPHWMITWPFDAAGNGLPTTVRDKGAWVMFAGTPYAYLHVCGTPWEGNEYHDGDKAVWTMSYARQ